MLTEVEIHLNTDPEHRFTMREDAHREFALWYTTDKSGESAAEEAFHISNAPEELLSAREKDIKVRWKGRSLSVGDIVIVAECSDNVLNQTHYLCCSNGWKQLKITSLERL